ncbi:hypothetical protein CAPTEDRAFT_179932 [Capitella teleta]|uniref:Phosphoglucomutase-2 n=1 Tax=Capitella teleta TaxID=283909 RepID=R7UWY2_CAPTE|nr:hypothetical protein CAPTEDRAFT_179932 [Capitella teleta]|eukprot:ELU07916.1 hypothetical protein CAPTEDRAFT_179932 [Capitella teleta]
MWKFVTGDSDVDVRLQEWFGWDKNEKTRAELEKLVAENDVVELRKRLLTRMEFGTAGLRSAMGAGYSRMNDLTIIQTTQGFGHYMLKVTPNVKDRGVVIGYDARHNSRRFAELASTVLLNLGIRVYLFSKITPTPFVPFGVVRLKTDWGIMVTASHNPKQDNGYKVYFRNGAQIIPPHDAGIAASILEHLTPEGSSWDTSQLAHRLQPDPFAELWQAYMASVTSLSFSRSTNSDSPVNFTYTAMHGVGYEAIQAATKAFNFKAMIPVLQQVEPDPEFPTVKFPNPEEGKSALDLAIQTANENNCTVIVANDPDADRLALAERNEAGAWHVFTGNDIGGLIGWWLITQRPLASDMYCLSSTVSSKILRSICLKEGLHHVETLTGFKWMANGAIDLMNAGKSVVFAFEEAIGFMCGTEVLDKDGISAAMVAMEMTSYLYRQGLTLKQQLDKLHITYGHHVSNNSYFICHDSTITKKMFDRLRDYEGSGFYPTHCGPYRILNVRDLTTGFDSRHPDKKADLPSSASSQMLTFYFENGCEITLRTSGTEPKIKYYSELCVPPEKGRSRESVETELKEVVRNMIEHFYQPELNHLIARSS